MKKDSHKRFYIVSTSLLAISLYLPSMAQDKNVTAKQGDGKPFEMSKLPPDIFGKAPDLPLKVAKNMLKEIRPTIEEKSWWGKAYDYLFSSDSSKNTTESIPQNPSIIDQGANNEPKLQSTSPEAKKQADNVASQGDGYSAPKDEPNNESEVCLDSDFKSEDQPTPLKEDNQQSSEDKSVSNKPFEKKGDAPELPEGTKDQPQAAGGVGGAGKKTSFRPQELKNQEVLREEGQDSTAGITNYTKYDENNTAEQKKSLQDIDSKSDEYCNPNSTLIQSNSTIDEVRILKNDTDFLNPNGITSSNPTPFSDPSRILIDTSGEGTPQEADNSPNAASEPKKEGESSDTCLVPPPPPKTSLGKKLLTHV